MQIQPTTIDSRQVTGVAPTKPAAERKISKYFESYNAACRRSQDAAPSVEGKPITRYIERYNSSTAETMRVKRVPLQAIDPFKVVLFPDVQLSDDVPELFTELNRLVGSTPSPDEVNALMEKGAMPTTGTLDIALRSKTSIGVVRQLLTKVKSTESTLATAFSCKVSHEMIRLLVEACASRPTLSTLHTALCNKASPESIAFLLSFGIKPLSKAFDRSTLYIALLHSARLKTVELLIAAGAALEDRLLVALLIAPDYYKNLYTEEDGKESVKILRLLLDSGVHPNNTNGCNNSLFLAEYCGPASSEIIKMLEGAGALPSFASFRRRFS